jgi:hypothetical protein
MHVCAGPGTIYDLLVDAPEPPAAGRGGGRKAGKAGALVLRACVIMPVVRSRNLLCWQLHQLTDCPRTSRNHVQAEVVCSYMTALSLPLVSCTTGSGRQQAAGSSSDNEAAAAAGTDRSKRRRGGRQGGLHACGCECCLESAGCSPAHPCPCTLLWVDSSVGCCL